MNAVFADSFYFFALLNSRDHAHEAARTFSRAFGGVIVSTSWVFLELGDGLSVPRDRMNFIRLLDRFSADPLCRMIAPSPELFDAGTDLYRSRPDQSWSLTDALTGDHHFTQAGFRAVLA